MGEDNETGEEFDSTGLKVTATYSDGNTEDVTADCTFTIDNMKDYTFTKEDAENGSKQVTITHFTSGQTANVDVDVFEIRMVIADKGKKFDPNDLNSLVGMSLAPMNMDDYSWLNAIEITQDMINKKEVTVKITGSDWLGRPIYTIYYRTVGGTNRLNPWD